MTICFILSFIKCGYCNKKKDLLEKVSNEALCCVAPEALAQTDKQQLL